MIPYFGLEINSGLQASNAATERAGGNLGTAIGGIIAGANKAYHQNKWNSELERLLAEREQIPWQGLSDAQIQERQAKTERDLRNHDIIGHAKGLRTTLIPWQYNQLDQHKADIAQKNAEMEWKLQDDEKNQVMQAYRNAMSQHRMIWNQATMAEATGQATPEFAKSIAELKASGNVYRDQAANLKKLGLEMGIKPEYFADIETETPPAGGATAADFSDLQGREAELAKEFMANRNNSPTKADLRTFLKGQGLNLKDSEFDKIYSYADNIHSAKEADANRQYEIQQKNLALAAAKRSDAKGEGEAASSAAWSEAQMEFLRKPGSREYTAQNAITLGRLFPDFKSNEQMGGKTIADVLGSWANRKLNEEQRRTEYQTYVNAMLKMLPADAAQTEPPKKRRPGQQ